MSASHGIADVEWIDRFAAAMCAEQPTVDRHLAIAVAKVVLPTLGVLKPEDAVATYLAVQMERHDWAENIALQALGKIRDSR